MSPKRRSSRNEKGQPAKQDTDSSTDGTLNQQKTKKEFSTENFPVAALGASAGGLEAFTKFLSNIPKDSGIAFVLVQHLDPSHVSRLPELLGRQSPVPVLEAINGTRLQTDHVYVIPPGKNMYISNRTLILAERPAPGLGRSIDIFFQSLAEDLKEQGIGIILSGTGNDGVVGAKAIKSQLGMVIVQDPDTAQYNGMPRAAIAAGVEDYVLPPEEMVRHLIGYIRQSYNKRRDVRQAIAKDGTNLQRILTLIRAKTRHDFSGYKATSVNRRIERRMSINQIDNIGDYFKFLQKHPAEIESLVKDFLINVTSFFRDPEAFAVLQKKIGELVKKKPEGSEIRVWIPGCSTGEEAYSIAIVLIECVEELKRYYGVQVFGTDLDADAIATARAGNYPLAIAQDVGEERLNRFFNRLESSYQIKRDMRDRLVFAVQDLITDPPYSRMDVVSVRNLLIYLDTELQRKLISSLHYSLNEGGILFLGTAETIGDYADFFATVDRKWRIYRCINKQKAPPDLMPANPAWQKALPAKVRDAGALVQAGLKQAILPEHLLLEALPPSVLIDHDYQVIFTHGNTGKYLQLPEGKPIISLLQMVNPDLTAALATALQEATLKQTEVVRERVHAKHNGHILSVRITVIPLPKSEGNLVVTFQDISRLKRRKAGQELEPDVRYRELDQELQYTRENLRSTVEELETANEELESANEEFQSTNEELQSANEELESSREELQSTNEELETINNEYQKKIEQLDTVNDDMKNLLNSTGIATVFLDEELRIQRFTPAATRLFNFVELDVGRPVGHITSRLKFDNLPQIARKVLDTLVPVELTVQNDEGVWYSMRIHPYRTTDNTIAGVVVSFIDISKEKAALAYVQSVIDTVREPMLVLDERLRVMSVNRGFYETFHVTKQNTEGLLIYELGKRQWDIPELRKLLENILPKDSLFDGYRVEHDFPEIGHRAMLLNARRVYDERGAAPRILLAMEDITSRAGVKELHKTNGVRIETAGKEENEFGRKRSG